MAEEVTMIFDIGKTNKKFFLFDINLNVLHQEYIQFELIPDDDGSPSEDLKLLTNWIIERIESILLYPEYALKAINFSTYGASMVHLGRNGEIISPFYNYTKPFPEELKQRFFNNYDNEPEFSLITASPSMGFLNSGLQLYYLKYKKPEVFKKLHQSLHFPQYLSYLLTGKFVTEYTSLGCHTGLWNYQTNSYAPWVKTEGLEKYLAPLKPASEIFQTNLKGRQINIGIGVHDSSAALIPYFKNSTKPFVLISTGTWSICMNPFNDQALTKSELQNDCLDFLGIRGQSVKASRLFLGQELEDQVIQLADHFDCNPDRSSTIQYNNNFSPLSKTTTELIFKYIHLNPLRFGYDDPNQTNYDLFESFDQAYHQLMYELTNIQIASVKLAIGNSPVQNIFIDGGFAKNELFTKMLETKLPQYKISTSENAMGSAIGAAMLVTGNSLPSGKFNQI